MDKRNAIKALKPYAKCKISSIYDKPEFPEEAILTLCPSFEYPNWSYMTIEYFLNKMEHNGKE